MVLVRLLASMHDERGRGRGGGLHAGDAADLDYPEAQLRIDAGVLDGVELIGTGALTSRLWTRPTVTVTGIDLPSTGQASNTLQAHVRAKLSVRVAPGQAAAEVFEAVRHHLLEQPAWGARVEVTLKETGEAFAAQAEGPAYDAARAAFADAWGVQPVDVGIGGSIPFIAEFASHLPGRRDPGHRGRGPGHPRARRRREPAPRVSSSGSASPRRSCSSAWPPCRADARRPCPGRLRRTALGRSGGGGHGRRVGRGRTGRPARPGPAQRRGTGLRRSGPCGGGWRSAAHHGLWSAR